jgi:hypothetical protein
VALPGLAAVGRIVEFRDVRGEKARLAFGAEEPRGKNKEKVAVCKAGPSGAPDVISIVWPPRAIEASANAIANAPAAVPSRFIVFLLGEGTIRAFFEG